MYSLLTTFGERKNTIFHLLFLKESMNQILACNKDTYYEILCCFFCVIFLFQFEKKYHAGGPAKRKSSWSGLRKGEAKSF